ncbi:MAG: VOC family protein [Anaerolineales bacterium]|nr:VOC family protein [Anaerolineales bacterium]MDW8226247.1 VOC family protein [Anaerolineales bacterium]
MSFDQFIVFLYTTDLEAVTHFYADLLGLPLVRDQKTCRIFRIMPSAYLGFCTHLDAPRPEGVILTLVVDDVDGWYQHFLARGVKFVKPPTYHPSYRIYHCFFKDPNGYLLEIQRFEEPLK